MSAQRLVARFWREMQKRTMALFPIVGLATLETASALAPSQKREKIGPTKYLVDTQDSTQEFLQKSQYATDFPWKYLQGLKVALLSMAKAGCYEVEIPKVYSTDQDGTKAPMWNGTCSSPI